MKAGARGDGSEAHPFGRIQDAVNAAGPGEVVVVRAGTYLESVSIKDKQGRPDAWILLRGEPGAFLTGAIPELEKSGDTSRWVPEGGGVFSTKLPHDSVGYVAAGEERLYRYYDLAELRSRAAGVNGGWLWDCAAGKLYVAMPTAVTPPRPLCGRLTVLTASGWRTRVSWSWKASTSATSASESAVPRASESWSADKPTRALHLRRRPLRV